MNRADVLMLNDAINNMGDSFRKNRVMAQQERENALDRAMRQQIVNEQVAQRRDAATARQQTLQDAVAARKQAYDMQAQRNEIQDKQHMLQAVLQANAGGMIDDEGRKKFNSFLASDPHFGQTGLQIVAPPKPAPPSVGQNSQVALVSAIQKYEEQAAALPDGDPRKAKLQGYAEQLRSFAGSKQQQLETITEPIYMKDPKTGQPMMDPATGKPMLQGTRRYQRPMGATPAPQTNAPASSPAIRMVRDKNGNLIIAPPAAPAAAGPAGVTQMPNYGDDDDQETP